jgi:hypothetical protein
MARLGEIIVRNDSDGNLPDVQSGPRASTLQPVVIQPVPRKLAGYLFMSLLMVLNGVWLLSLDPWSLVAWPSILLFGALMVMIAKQMLDARPTIMIDEAGIFDRANKLGLIEWDDITDAVVEGIKGFPTVRLQLRDPDKYRRRLSAVTRGLWALHERRDSVWIGLTGTNADAKQLADVLGKELRVRWSARAMGNT